MTERRALNAALQWLHGNENENERAAVPSTPRKSRRSREQKPALRHDRKCCICRHRERADIESEFLHWRSAESIAREYGIAHHSSIYRHARATGLFAQRATYVRLALGPIIEQAMVVPVTADSIVRAVALCARLNEDGELINPPKHVIYHSFKADESRPFPKAHRRNRSRSAELEGASQTGPKSNSENASSRP